MSELAKAILILCGHLVSSVEALAIGAALLYALLMVLSYLGAR